MTKSSLNHIAIIPDGNRRWARKHKLQAWLGHKQGMALLNDMCTTSVEYGIKYITFWACSVDNLTKRSKIEVKYLIQYIYEALIDPETQATIDKHNIQVRVLGRWKEIIKRKDVLDAIEDIQTRNRRNTGAYLTILLGYDGQDEMLTTINKLSAGKTASHRDHRINSAQIRAALWTGHLPDVDLVIRTGGEPHWSAGFMMWLTANSQFYFTDTLWPAFGTKHLYAAFKDYERRERRLGK
jgi:undecaprenyl diphosphate synthase